MSAEYDDSNRYSEPQSTPHERFGKIMLTQLTSLTSYSELKLFCVLSTYANESGVCWPSNDRLISDSKLSRSGMFKALAKLQNSGMIVIRTGANGRRLITLKKQGFETADSPPQKTVDLEAFKSTSVDPEVYGVPPPSLYEQRNEQIAEDTPKRGESSMTRVSNVSRNTPPMGRSSNAQHPGSPRTPAQPFGPNKADFADVCTSKIHEISGIWITDGAKFDTATPHRTPEEWLPFILEAWELKDTVLRNEKYPDFNAAKVINYVQHRAAYRKKIPKAGPGPALDYESELNRILEVNNVRRFQQLQNYVMCGLPRESLQGRISREEFAQLYPQAESSGDPGQSEHSADVHPARL